MAKRFCLGDVHGNYKGLQQVLERSGFDKENDLLITLGDICDGYSQVFQCVEELLSIKNRIDIQGNHDEPFLEYIETGLQPWRWQQGGDGTLKSYTKTVLGDNGKMILKMSGWISNLNPGDIPETHKEFFRHQILFYQDDDNNFFVHGGFNRHVPIKDQEAQVFLWDRDLWMSALSFKTVINEYGKDDAKAKFRMKEGFKDVFIGHTTTQNWRTTEPMRAVNIWNLDTGAGFAGKLTIMDIDTKEYWQSDLAQDLYPGEKGRRK